MLTLSQYKRGKGGIVSGLTKITKGIDTFLANASKEGIVDKLSSVLKQLDKYNDCRHEMETLYEADEYYFVDIEADLEYMEGLDQVIAHLKGKLKQKEPNRTAVATRNTIVENYPSCV